MFLLRRTFFWSLILLPLLALSLSKEELEAENLQIITDPSAPYSLFGKDSVYIDLGSLSQDRILVGSPRNAAKIQILRPNGQSIQSVSHPSSSSWFGAAIEESNYAVFVGAPGEQSGKVYAFPHFGVLEQYGSSIFSQTGAFSLFAPPSGVTANNFGSSLLSFWESHPGGPRPILAVAAEGNPRTSGAVFLYDMSQQSTPVLIGTLRPNHAGDRFGASLASADFNGDGFLDLAIGAPNSQSGVGEVLLYHGPFFGNPGSAMPIAQLGAASAGENFGRALAAHRFGDTSYLAISAPLDHRIAPNAGRVSLYEQSPSSGRMIYAQDLGFFRSGDLAGDALAFRQGSGYLDLLIGSRGGSNVQSLRIQESPRTSAPLPRITQYIQETFKPGTLGGSIQIIPDQNADRDPDLLLGGFSNLLMPTLEQYIRIDTGAGLTPGLVASMLPVRPACNERPGALASLSFSQRPLAGQLLDYLVQSGASDAGKGVLLIGGNRSSQSTPLPGTRGNCGVGSDFTFIWPLTLQLQVNPLTGLAEARGTFALIPQILLGTDFVFEAVIFDSAGVIRHSELQELNIGNN